MRFELAVQLYLNRRERRLHNEEKSLETIGEQETKLTVRRRLRNRKEEVAQEWDKKDSGVATQGLARLL